MQKLDNSMGNMEEIGASPSQVCFHCHERIAEIFQVSGDYCLECWQTITHTNP